MVSSWTLSLLGSNMLWAKSTTSMGGSPFGVGFYRILNNLTLAEEVLGLYLHSQWLRYHDTYQQIQESTSQIKNEPITASKLLTVTARVCFALGRSIGSLANECRLNTQWKQEINAALNIMSIWTGDESLEKDNKTKQQKKIESESSIDDENVKCNARLQLIIQREWIAMTESELQLTEERINHPKYLNAIEELWRQQSRRRT
ncbi:MAG: hypothetical protein EZS28_002992 [Streblomastix strix]|uniref:Uncharacterized protein n=1 Tax=Streblomastix strix TaxID=222440 RepID=A0A5J4X4P3_9EUKA|nr:MAG: hypothetical protein EZS28_002992 [Streblomastix strix]